MKILVIYANSSSKPRRTFEEFLYSFRNHLPQATVFYHNAIFNKAPIIPGFRNVDLVIFHHSVTTVWHRGNYKQKIVTWAAANFGDAKKIALMQDEYKNIDLLQQFLQDVGISTVFSVAPRSEWSRLYGQWAVNNLTFIQLLTGYIADEGITTGSHALSDRSIDIGYRTDWSKFHVKLGKTGLLKRDISEVFQQIEHRFPDLRFNVKHGSEHFLNGYEWHRFLDSCRYILGVPSGSSVLDPMGNIETSLTKAISSNPLADESALYQDHVSEHEATLALAVFSPRFFEALSHGCGLILIESDYNGILHPWRHYLPLKPDFSNVDEILLAAENEAMRLQLLENCRHDILANRRYHYSHIARFIVKQSVNTINTDRRGNAIWLTLNRLSERAKNLLLVLRTLVKRWF